jgi:DNA-binding response OmpR family regulator
MTPSDPVVMVVDDEPDVADSYAVIAGERYDVRTAYSGEQALAELDDDLDVVLLDRRMPDILGEDVLAEIRDRGIDCRVAMVTAVDPGVDKIDMEFDDYVVKPVTREELLDTVDRLLRVAEYERTLREYYRVTRKHAALSAATSAGDLTDDPEFVELTERRDHLGERLAETADRFADADFEALFRDLDEDGPSGDDDPAP